MSSLKGGWGEGHMTHAVKEGGGCCAWEKFHKFDCYFMINTCHGITYVT